MALQRTIQVTMPATLPALVTTTQVSRKSAHSAQLLCALVSRLVVAQTFRARVLAEAFSTVRQHERRG